jgi:hypothetical protein
VAIHAPDVATEAAHGIGPAAHVPGRHRRSTDADVGELTAMQALVENSTFVQRQQVAARRWFCATQPPHSCPVSEEPVPADGLHAASEQARTWERAVERAERRETVAVLAHGRHVADVLPSGEIERLRETIDVLADNDLLRELHTGTSSVNCTPAWRTFEPGASLPPTR